MVAAAHAAAAVVAVSGPVPAAAATLGVSGGAAHALKRIGHTQKTPQKNKPSQEHSMRMGKKKKEKKSWLHTGKVHIIQRVWGGVELGNA